MLPGLQLRQKVVYPRLKNVPDRQDTEDLASVVDDRQVPVVSFEHNLEGLRRRGLVGRHLDHGTHHLPDWRFAGRSAT